MRPRAGEAGGEGPWVLCYAMWTSGLGLSLERAGVRVGRGGGGGSRVPTRQACWALSQAEQTPQIPEGGALGLPKPVWLLLTDLRNTGVALEGRGWAFVWRLRVCGTFQGFGEKGGRDHQVCR